MLVSPESLDRLAQLVPAVPLDPSASLERTVTTVDLANLVIEVSLDLRVLVDSPEPLDFPE